MSRPAQDRTEEFNRRVDFGRTANDYGRHRAGFPDEFFARLRTFHVGLPGQRVLDLGSGTGTLARGLAAAGCRVTALDPAAPMLREGCRLAEETHLALDYVIAKSEALPLESATQDVITAGQCWHWFDRTTAAAEARRVLTADGLLVIAHFDWLPLAGSPVEATEKLIERCNPDWHFGGSHGCYPQWLPGVSAAGFTEIETFSFDHMVPYSHEGWRGRIRASAGVAATLSEIDVIRFDQELAQLLAEQFPQDPLTIPHRVYAIVAVSR
ncbi:MAG TPA: methyltransferase domain-containing protein [Pirellulales bacterium]